MTDDYREHQLRILQTVNHYSVHNPVVVVTASPEKVKGYSVHGPVIVAPTTKEAKELLQVWTNAQVEIERARR